MRQWQSRLEGDVDAGFVHNESGLMTVKVQLGIYGLTPLLATAHRFTDRCYVHLEYADASTVMCRFQRKQRIDSLEDIAGEFMNELLDQQLRSRLAEKTEPVRNLLLAQAFSRTNLLQPELDAADPVADPCGITSPDAR